MDAARVAKLANDIAAQFAYQPRTVGAESVAAHIRRFWEPGMRADLVELASGPDSGLDSLARAAADLLISAS